MDASIRRRALEAAAKVAFSVTSLTGCGGLAVETSTFVTSDAAADAPIDPIVLETGLRDNPPPDSSAVIQESTFQSCKSHLQEAADASPPQSVAALPETGACCSAILSYCRGPGLLPGCAFYDVVSLICCPLLQNPNVPFCGPWGPPTPPALPHSRVEAMA